MPKGKRHPATLAVNILIALVAVAMSIVLLEIGLRFMMNVFSSEGPPLQVLCGDCPQIYELNPDHHEVSAQGFRDKEYAFTKTPGITRVVVLGDSVAYGLYVSPELAFPNFLESRLNRRENRFEVINAAVSGYTPYNELQLYKSKLRRLRPDIVVVAFSMNDIVDPKLHWNYTQDAIANIPDAAIPNTEYHEAHVVPTVEALKDTSRPWFEELSRLQSRLTAPDFLEDERLYTEVNGRRWPTYVTGEDVIGIQTLMDYDSPEWVWLRSVYDELQAEIEAGGARMVLLALPLAYQMDPDYPFLPQELLRKYADEAGIQFVDVLPAFRANAEEPIFQDEAHGYMDIWHLTRAGHRLVALELEEALGGD
ncbi:MAG: hypothetical protein FJ319_09150 [SAR202 cluster bacterium]|nr:hypothetical protein [SAR202 cluster bacterium]